MGDLRWWVLNCVLSVELKGDCVDRSMCITLFGPSIPLRWYLHLMIVAFFSIFGMPNR